MAGNFILKSITQSDLNTAISFPHIAWSTSAAHAKGLPVNPDQPEGRKFQGWTSGTAHTLSRALRGEDIGNREGLPPHRYLEIAAWVMLTQQEQAYVQGAGWVSNLEYPGTASVGLKALAPLAATAWSTGDKTTALVETLKKGAVSIEVYFQSGMRMY